MSRDEIPISVVNADNKLSKTAASFDNLAHPIGPYSKENAKKFLYYQDKDNPPQGKILSVWYTPLTPKTPDEKENQPVFIAIIKGLKKNQDAEAMLLTKVSDDEPPKFKRDTTYGQHATYSDLARWADEITTNLAEKYRQDDLEMTEEKAAFNARARIGRDIIRASSGKEIKGTYSSDEWKKIAIFGATVRLDIARSLNTERSISATPYITKTLKNNAQTFSERFTGDKPTYVGAPSGGSQKLRDERERRVKTGENVSTDTDISSDEDKSMTLVSGYTIPDPSSIAISEEELRKLNNLVLTIEKLSENKSGIESSTTSSPSPQPSPTKKSKPSPRYSSPSFTPSNTPNTRGGSSRRRNSSPDIS